MSNLFSGKTPFSRADKGDKDERRGDTSGISSLERRDATTGAQPRPAFGQPAAPAAGPRVDAPRPSLFTQKEAPKAPLSPRGAAQSPGTAPAAGQVRPPLFPSRTSPAAGTGAAPASAPRAPLFPPRADAPRAPLFPPKSDAPRAPLFPPRPAAPAAGGAAPAAGQARAPLFPRKDSAPAAPFKGSAGRHDIKVSDEEFVQLRDFLYQQSGIFVAENRKYLMENRLSSRLRELGLRSFSEYYNYLRYDEGRAAEMNKLFESMTTNETSFFRNIPQLDVFRDKVLIPTLNAQKARGQKKLRIWSAGCSSGEEPYTLAIILYEVLRQDISNWDIKITANDLSLAVLSSARRGLYNDYAIRTTPEDILARYFTKEGNLYRIDPRLQKLVSFGQINLKDKEQLQKVEHSQIVFCRNVIIYFDDEMKKGVINAFYDNLLPGGYLIIGHSESLHDISRAFKPEHYAGSIVYCKQS
ncbi:MAG: chemotaxis protein CheR [Desulfovibrionaceae bacterium]|nr:chemotaxis protein CheR [Desulfovibrionaceae bacterium]